LPPPALFEPIKVRFRREMKGWAQASGVPVIAFRASEREAEMIGPDPEAAAATGRA